MMLLGSECVSGEVIHSRDKIRSNVLGNGLKDENHRVMRTGHRSWNVMRYSGVRRRRTGT